MLLSVVFLTFSLQFFESTRIVPLLLRLSPAVWEQGFLWQLLTYPVAGYGGASLWFLFELLILYWFSRDVYARLGRRNFWLLMVWATGGGAVAASAMALVSGLLGAERGPELFVLMQGQRALVVIAIAAFATLWGRATIYLFFVLPVQARWFLWIEVLFAFMGFLQTRDIAGFVGICSMVAVTYNLLSSGGLKRALREVWLRLEQRRIQAKLARLRRRRGIRAVEDRDPDREDPGDPWVH